LVEAFHGWCLARACVIKTKLMNAAHEPMKVFTLQTELWLPRPREEVFPFFADARNLETITPPWLKFEVLTYGDLLRGYAKARGQRGIRKQGPFAGTPSSR